MDSQEELEDKIVDFRFEQMFTTYGEPVPIWAPQLNMAPALTQASNSNTA